jgi:hypothetical protein
LEPAGVLHAAGLELAPGFAGVEWSEPVGRAERGAGEPRRGAPGAGGPDPGSPAAGLASALVDDAVNRARVRRSVGELPGGGRISDEVIDELLAGASTEEEIAGPGGLLAELTKRLVERAMEVELTDHLGYEPHQEPPGGTENTRICRVRHMRVHVAPETMLRRGCRTCG